MKLQNKKTGYITNWCIDKDVIRTCDGSIVYNSLAELNEEWEDAPEEQKEYHWYRIDRWGGIEENCDNEYTLAYVDANKEIGNYFETREEAEKAVEKLKAWKRLKDKGFRFNDWYWECQTIDYNLDYTAISEEDIIEAKKDLDLLFGGEE